MSVENSLSPWTQHLVYLSVNLDCRLIWVVYVTFNGMAQSGFFENIAFIVGEHEVLRFDLGPKVTIWHGKHGVPGGQFDTQMIIASLVQAFVVNDSVAECHLLT